MSSALIPAATALVSVGLFDNASRALNGELVSNELYFYAALYLIIYIINDFLFYAFSIAVNSGIYEKGTAFFRIALYEKIAKLPLIAFENIEILDQQKRAEFAVNDETLSSTFNHTLRFSSSIISVISVAAVLIHYSAWLLPLSLLSVLPYLFARIMRGKEFYELKHSQAKKARLRTYLWNLFTNKDTAKEMRVMGFDGYITDKWRDIRDEINEQLWKLQKKDAGSLLCCDVIRISGYCISIAIVLFLVIQNQITLGVFGASIAAFLSLQNSMREFLSDLGEIPEQLSYAKDYYLFLDLPEEKDGKEIYPGLKKDIVLKDISFAYPNHENYALKSVNLHICKGEKIAILGENGSGKSTLFKVLLGLYPAENGNVLYDGKSIDNFNKNSLYQTVSAVTQDFVSYNLTFRENIALSDVSRINNDSEIETALSNSGIEENEYKNSLDVTMGREFGGKELSGGQWQKLAISRGLFRNSELIILDEPTSALDPVIETEILTEFIKASEHKTALIISHRVGLCKLVDRIIVMKEGKVAEIGTHNSLMALNGEYARLYTEQAKWYDN